MTSVCVFKRSLSSSCDQKGELQSHSGLVRRFLFGSSSARIHTSGAPPTVDHRHTKPYDTNYMNICLFCFVFTIKKCFK